MEIPRKKKKRKNWKKILLKWMLPTLGVVLFGGMIALAVGMSISSYNDEAIRYTEGYQIEGVSQVTDEDGSITVTVTFKNNALDPITFTVSPGVSGEEGVTITNIDTSLSDTTITFTISYSDETIEDTVFTVPLVYGDEGRTITGVDITTDEDGDIHIVFNYSDDTSSEEIVLPKGQVGQDGEDGATISYIDTVENEDGSIDVVIHYSDSSIPDTTINIVKGEDATDGKTIVRITTDSTQSTSEQLAIVIIYSDGTSETIYLPINSSTNWLYSGDAPIDTQGNVGDFYINVSTGEVYVKTESGWGDPLFIMKGTGTSHIGEVCNVTFNLNGGTWSDGTGSLRTFILTYDSFVPSATFTALGSPIKEGYEFIGWYSTLEYSPNAGKLDSLTKIVDDINVYAWYSEVV